LKTAGHQSAIPSDRQIGLKSMTQHIAHACFVFFKKKLA
jgi:hypothetical protein